MRNLNDGESQEEPGHTDPAMKRYSMAVNLPAGLSYQPVSGAGSPAFPGFG